MKTSSPKSSSQPINTRQQRKQSAAGSVAACDLYDSHQPKATLISEHGLLFTLISSFVLRSFARKLRRQGIVGPFLVPQNTEHPPALPIIDQLNAVNAPLERLGSRSAPRFVTAEDLRYVSKTLRSIHDRIFVERILLEHVSRHHHKIVDPQQIHHHTAVRRLHSLCKARLRNKQGTKPFPIAITRRTRDHVINRQQYAIQRLHVLRARRGNLRSQVRTLRTRRTRWLGVRREIGR